GLQTGARRSRLHGVGSEKRNQLAERQVVRPARAEPGEERAKRELSAVILFQALRQNDQLDRRQPDVAQQPRSGVHRAGVIAVRERPAQHLGEVGGNLLRRPHRDSTSQTVVATTASLWRPVRTRTTRPTNSGYRATASFPSRTATSSEPRSV